jgi:hypothetical protein
MRNRTGAEQVAEKVLITGEIPEKHTSAAKAAIDSTGLIPGLKSRPTAGRSFSADWRAATFQNSNLYEGSLAGTGYW